MEQRGESIFSVDLIDKGLIFRYHRGYTYKPIKII